MNKLRIIFAFLLAILGVHEAKAQDSTNVSDSEESSKVIRPLSIFAQVGLMNYRGDIGYIDGLGSIENFELSYAVGAEYRLFDQLGIEAFGSYGVLSKSERNRLANRNFQNTMFGGGINLSYHFSNGYILPLSYAIDPYIFTGISFNSISVKTDLLDANGNTYYYWPNGGIYDDTYNSVNLNVANEIERDYVYETDVDPNGQSTFVLGLPLGTGVDFTVNKFLTGQIRNAWYFTNSDFLDGYVAGNAKDSYMFTSLGIAINPYKIGKKDKNSEFDDIDFKSLLLADGDADGVPDIDDFCQDTDEGVKVNKHGCPVDKDGDGYADHEDQELDTPEEALAVDSNGVAIPDSVIAEQALDTIVTLREELCKFYPSMCIGNETDIEFQLLNTGKADKEALLGAKVEKSTRPIEEITAIADINKDGKISVKEIYEAIDLYFEGKVDLDLGDIHKLIDHFFEQ